MIPALMEKLHKGGILAVQIPMNGEEPLFQIIQEEAQKPQWGLADVQMPPNQTLAPLEYFSILSSCASAFDMWQIQYYHPLANHKALIEWVKGTRLRPYLEYLGPTRAEEFEQAIVEQAKQRYPVQKNGEVVLGFRRFFFTAQK